MKGWFGVTSVMTLITLALVVGACGGSGEVRDTASDALDPNVVARYGDETLSKSEYESRYAKSVGGWDAALSDSMPEYVDFLERYVDFRLKVMAAVDAGIDQDSALVAELDTYREQLARPYLVDKAIVEDLVDELYERQQFEVSASHILVRVGSTAPEDTLAAYEKISMLRDSVVAGADFNEVAFNNSEDPSAKRNRGYLGTFSGGRMIAPFEDRAFTNPVGEISDVFRTQFGYHLLYVHERGPKTPEISASHILIRATEGDSASFAEAELKVQEAQTRLDAGEDFADVALAISEDPGSASRGGSLGFFGRGRMVPAFDSAAFALTTPGERSGWFTTRFGFHIIQLDEIGTLPSYDESYDELKSLAQRLPRFQEAERRYGLALREELPATIDTAAIAGMVASFPPDSILYFVALEQWSDADKATVIGSLGDRSFTMGEFIEYGMSRRAEKPRSYDLDQVYRLINDMYDARAIDVAAGELEETDADFAELMQEYRDGIILFRVMEDSVWHKAANDSAAIEALYESRAGEYRFPERARVVSYYASDDSLLGVLSESWMPGDTTDWGAQFGDNSRFRVDTMFVADSTRSIYDRVLGMEPGAVVGPIPYRSGRIVLAVDGIEAPRSKTLVEARAEVLGEYQETVEDAWLARLRARYGAMTYPQNLMGVFEPDSGTSDTDMMGASTK